MPGKELERHCTGLGRAHDSHGLSPWLLPGNPGAMEVPMPRPRPSGLHLQPPCRACALAPSSSSPTLLRRHLGNSHSAARRLRDDLRLCGPGHTAVARTG